MKVIFIFCLAGLILPGCGQSKKGQEKAPDLSSYADSVFLEIKDNLNEPENVFKNKDVFDRAGNRLEQQLFIENVFFRWNIKQGADVKISENIFQYFVRSWTQQNEFLKTGEYEIRNIRGRRFAILKDISQSEIDSVDLDK